MDFSFLNEENGKTRYPFAYRQINEDDSYGDWNEGKISIEFLNKHFGHLETAEEMKNATNSEGLKLYFDWLKEKGILN